MLVVALYVGVEPVRALGGGSHVDESALAFALALVSLLVLPWLGVGKLRIARALPSHALRGDGS